MFGKSGWYFTTNFELKGSLDYHWLSAGLMHIQVVGICCFLKQVRLMNLMAGRARIKYDKWSGFSTES